MGILKELLAHASLFIKAKNDSIKAIISVVHVKIA
jgi:hypothetical protein